MELTPESIEEFHTTEHSLLLGDTELSSLKSEVEAEASLSKRPKKRGQHALDTSHISAMPAKKKKGEPGDKVILISPMKKRAAPVNSDTPTTPTKKAKGI